MGAQTPWHRWLVLLLLLLSLGLSLLTACSEERSPLAGDATETRDDPPDVNSPPGASVWGKVQVPAGMCSAPFDVDRYLILPPGFSIAVYACVEDTQSNPKRGAIYEYSAEGGAERLFAQGLRNAEGLAFVPGTSDVWVVMNDQNAIAYPYDDATDRYGEVIRSCVDDHPPATFTRVRDGGTYGWPFCNPTHDRDGTIDYGDMPYDPDYRANRSGHVDCAAMDRLTKGMQAHSAPPGLTFLQGTNFPTASRQGAVVALHGSGQPRSTRTGAKLIYFPWNNATRLPGPEIDLVAGRIIGENYWGRPVDAAVGAEGHMFISDDHSGTIYKLVPSR